jgi:hypothetical protein
MTIIAIITGLAAAVLLLTAGYLFGVRKGEQAREALRYEAQRLTDYVRQVIDQSSQRAAEQEGSLRTTIQEVLAPLVERERLSLDLAHFNTNVGRRRDLTPLLDKIAAVGNFTTVMLTNEEGLPLAASRASRDVERLAAATTRLALVADQIGGEGGHAALSIMVRDASDETTLCRMFRMSDGLRLSVTAVSKDPRLTSVVLDPALAKIEAALSTPSYS